MVDRGNSPLPTVPEAGFKTCLTKWRTGTRFYCREGIIFACIFINRFEYAFHMVPQNQENIYCSIVANEAFELGCAIGKQYYRLRNFGDNSTGFAVSFSLLNDEFKRVSLPSGENGIDFSGENDVCDNVSVKLERVKRYTDTRITVSNCGDELDYFRDDGDMVERFEGVGKG